jgi:filamentous hemagglutinin family protein
MNDHASLNRTYRLVWSDSAQRWMVAPETAKRARKGGRASRVLRAVMGALAAFVLASGVSNLTHAQQAPPSATQLPVANAVARGQVNITQSATSNAAVMNVHQSSQAAVVNWNSFNVGQSAEVNFNQPNSSSVILNRVLDNNPSQIWGRISAPGQVFISNANGIYFSPTSSVDVGALTATTHSISDDDFMAGKRVFDRQGARGKVINEGSITAALAGYVALLAPEVQNAGVIVARTGSVAMAAGDLITLNFDSNQGFAGITTTPSTIDALVQNKLAVYAPEGKIILSAVASNRLLAGVVNNSGTLEASSLVNKGGTIVLEGNDINLGRTSKIDVTGAKGGGTVLVGGDWQGSGSLRQATHVTLEQGGMIDASATEMGDGGKVVVWSDVRNADSVTEVAGAIYAKGGPQGGDGGRIETSGHLLKVNDSTGSASAPKGLAGEWLFDPYNVTISAGADASGSWATAGSIDTWTPSATSSTILNTTISSKLQSGTHVVVTTDGGAGAEAGNISVTSAIDGSGGASSSGDLTLVANNNITLSANVTLNNSHLVVKAGGNIVQAASTKINTNGGNVTYWADSDSSGTGGINLALGTALSQTSIKTNGGTIVMGGGANPSTNAAADTHGIYFVGFAELDTRSSGSAGDISLRGQSTAATANAGMGLKLINSSIIGGNVTLVGRGPSNSGGLSSGSATTTTVTASGNLILDGDLLSNGVNNNFTGVAGSNVVVNASQTWSANTIDLSAGGNLDVNANLDASAGGGLKVRFGQSTSDGSGFAYRVNGVTVKIALPSGTASNFKWRKGSTGNDNELVFNNGYMAFTEGADDQTSAPNQSAINNQGQLNQPNFYDLDTTVTPSTGSSKWQKLTFSNRSLEFLVGSGTTGTYWNGNSTSLSVGSTGGYLDISQYMPGVGTGPGAGVKASGTILSVVPLTVNSQSAQLISRYTLGGGDAYLRSDTSVKSLTATMSNVGLWVGTGDDFVGNSDSPIKTIGNFGASGFEANTVVGQPASVLRVQEGTSVSSAVAMFYSTDSSASATFNRCCSFTSATQVDPASQPLTAQNDGSYALYTGLGDIAAGATKGFTWFYVAAPSRVVNNVVNSVVSTLTTYSFNSAASQTYNYTGNPYTLENLWSQVTLNTGNNTSLLLQPGQPTSGYNFVYNGNPVTTLTNAGTYRLQIALTSDIASNYLLNNAGAATLTINPAPLTISGSSAANKVYNANTTATVTPGTLSGFIGLQSVGVTATGVFDSANVGLRNVTPTYTLTDGSNGGLARNYVITGSLGLQANITPATLTLSGTKVYDGTTRVLGSSLTATGVGSQTFSLSGTGDLSNLSSADVQTNNQLASVTGLTLGTSSNGGLANNYNAISASSSTYSITPKPITLTGYTVATRAYNGNTSATAGSATPVFGGVVAGDDVTLDATNFVGTFADKNVGTNKAVTVSGLALGGTDRLNYSLTAPTGVTGTITRLSSVTWSGGASGNWFDPANWTGGAVPDLANVANVVIPSGVTVNFNSTVVAPATAGTVQLDGINALASQVGSLNMTAGTLQVGSGGANLYSFTQTAGTATVGGNFRVANGFSQSGTASLSVTGNASISDDTSGVVLGALTVGGNLNLDSTGGAITQVSGSSLQVTGTASLSANNAGTAANIVLAEASNNFGGAVSASGANVSLRDANALVLGTISASGNLDVTTSGALTQTGPLTVAGTTQVDAGGGDITLSNAANNFGGALSASGANVSLRDANALVLGTLSASGSLAVTTSGALTQTGPLTVAGVAQIDAGVGDITLSDASNNFGLALSISGANVSLVDVDHLTLATVRSTGNLSVSVGQDLSFGNTQVSGNLVARAGSGSISQSDVMGVSGTLSLVAANAVDLSHPSNVFGSSPQVQAATTSVSAGLPSVLASTLGADPQKPVLSGTAPANTTVAVYSDGVALGTTTANAGGTWQFIPSDFMTPGNHVITARATLGAGQSGLSSPLSIVVNARFDTPNMVGASLQTQQSQAVSSSAALNASSLPRGLQPLVQVDQLASMSPQQLQTLTPLQASLLNPAQLASLEPAQVASFTPVQLRAFTPAQVTQLAPAQLEGLSPTQLSALTANAALNFGQLQALTPSQVASVQPTQFAKMSAAEIGSMGDAQLQALTPRQIAAIVPTQLAAITPEQLVSMGANLTQNLSPEQFGELTAFQISNLSPTQVAAVSPQQIQAMSKAQLSSLTSEQREAMTPLQMLAIGESAPLVVSDISPSQIAGLTVPQVQNLQVEHIQALSGLQVRGFTPEHIEVLSIQQMAAMTPVQLQALTTEQISNLSLSQVAALSPSQVSVMSDGQRSALPKGGVLPIEVLGGERAPAAGVEFDIRRGRIEVRTTEMVPPTSAATPQPPTGELQSFTLTTSEGQSIELKGALVSGQLLISAPDSNSKEFIKNNLLEVLKVAINSLNANPVDPTELGGVILDFR